nr:MAG TPA: hypothetical protein [Caudoviricetes sp.]
MQKYRFLLDILTFYEYNVPVQQITHKKRWKRRQRA